MFALGIIVANVPEGLLPTISLALAMGVRRMAARNAIVKQLERVETLGAVTVIVTDKTGTLTENQMTAREIWLPDRRYWISRLGYAPRGEIRCIDDNPADLSQLLLTAALCCDAQLQPPQAASDHWGWSVIPPKRPSSLWPLGALIYVPFLAHVFQLTPLATEHWLILMTCGPALLILE